MIKVEDTILSNRGNKITGNSNTFSLDPYDTWDHEHLLNECRRRKLL